MALGEKYRVHLDHQFGGSSRYLQIFAEGYSGGVSELTSGGTPVILEYPGSDNDILDNVFGSELELTLISLTSEQFIEFATAKNKEYLGKVYNDDDVQTEWQGWLVPSEYEEPYNQAPYTTSVIFNCGIGMAKNYQYLNGTDYYVGRATEMAIITNCLKFIYPSTLSTTHRPDLRVAMGLEETTMSTSMGVSPLALAYVDQEKYINADGTVQDCLAVIKDILSSYGARILMGLLGWWIVRIRDYALFADSYEMGYQRYSEEGVFVSFFGLTEANTVLEVTGPQARSSMVGWIGGSQMVRHERAYREIILVQDYLYDNIIIMGDFPTDQWDDFWTVNATATREQGSDPNTFQISIGTAASYIQQNFTVEGTGTSPEQRIILSFEAMVEHDNSYTGLDFTIEMFRSQPAGGQYLVGVVGGGAPVNPVWQVAAGSLFFTTEGGVPPSGEWGNFELSLEYFPSDADCWIRFKHMGTAGAGSITGVFYRNIKMFGNYEGEPPVSNNEIITPVSDDNILQLIKKDITLGDITEQGNEGLFFKGAKTTDSAGDVPTVLWRTTRRNTTVRAPVGPDMSLSELIMDNLITQHGAIRKRLSGRMVFEIDRWGLVVIKDSGIYYVPTQISVDLKRGEIDLSMVELPPMGVEVIDDNLLTAWTNVDFDVFTSSGPIITSLEDSGDGPASANHDTAISYRANETFRLQMTYDSFTGAGHNNFKFGSYDAEMTGDGMDVIITPGTTAGSDTPRIRNDGEYAMDYTNLVITLVKAYGY